jgi:hypothetical protein
MMNGSANGSPNGNGADSRRSFRVEETVYLKYDVISDREFHEGLDRRKLRLGVSDGLRSIILDLDTRLDQQLYRLKAEADPVGECLATLNEKINVVIQQLPEMRESQSALARSKPLTCAVGADGMAFSAEKNYEVGTKLALRFLLESDNRYIETFCQVVRQIDPPGDIDVERPFGIAVEFQGMKTSQKEILIQHLFERESETLRMRRLNLDAMQ